MFCKLVVSEFTLEEKSPNTPMTLAELAALIQIDDTQIAVVNNFLNIMVISSNTTTAKYKNQTSK